MTTITIVLTTTTTTTTLLINHRLMTEKVSARGKNAQAYATTLLNITFQTSSFLAVVVSVGITTFIMPVLGFQ
jgi:hypothetical protein